MKIKLPIIKWLKRKKAIVTELKSSFKLRATFSESINFLVKYPTTDKHSFIKEFSHIEWEQEIEMMNPANVYFKIFLTSNNFLIKATVILEIFKIVNSEVVETKNTVFEIGKDLNNNEWLKISWV